MNGGKGLYDDEINCLAERVVKGTTMRWLGVFVRDELPNEEELLQAARTRFVLHLPFALVFNNQPASEPGQHWLAIFGMAAEGGSVDAQNGGGGGLHIEFFTLMLCLQPHIHCTRISNVSSTFHSVRFNRLALLCVVTIVCIFYLLARTVTLSLL